MVCNMNNHNNNKTYAIDILFYILICWYFYFVGLTFNMFNLFLARATEGTSL